MGVVMRKLITRNTRHDHDGGGGHPARRRARRGAALVEMAIVIPILCMLTLGLMEYGWVFVKVSQVNQAARNAVRVAVRPDATTQDVQNTVARLMSQAGIPSGKYTYACTDLGVDVGEPVQVKITVNYAQITLTGTGLVPLPDVISGHGVMSKEGPATTPPPAP